MCDLFAPTSLDSLVKHGFYYTTVEAIEENIFIYSFIEQAFNEHLFYPVSEAGDTEMNKTCDLFSGNSPSNGGMNRLIMKWKKCFDGRPTGSYGGIK